MVCGLALYSCQWEATMHQDLQEELDQIGRDVLALYERAVAIAKLDVAEHLLKALETIAESQPRAAELRSRAYLRIRDQTDYLLPKSLQSTVKHSEPR